MNPSDSSSPPSAQRTSLAAIIRTGSVDRSGPGAAANGVGSAALSDRRPPAGPSAAANSGPKRGIQRANSKSEYDSAVSSDQNFSSLVGFVSSGGKSVNPNAVSKSISSEDTKSSSGYVLSSMRSQSIDFDEGPARTSTTASGSPRGGSPRPMGAPSSSPSSSSSPQTPSTSSRVTPPAKLAASTSNLGSSSMGGLGSRSGELRRSESVQSVDISKLYQGTVMLKFSSLGKPVERRFHLSRDNRLVQWSSFSFNFWKNRSIHIDRIVRLQKGQLTPNFERQKSTFGTNNSRSFSIVYDNNATLDVIAPTADDFLLWYRGLLQLLKQCEQEKENALPDVRHLHTLFSAADRDNSGSLSKREIMRVLGQININMPARVAEALLKKVDRNGNGVLEFAEFRDFIHTLRRRPDLEFLWSNIVTNARNMNFDGSTPFGIAVTASMRNSDGTAKDFVPRETLDAVIPIDRFVTVWARIQSEAITAADIREFKERVFSSSSSSSSSGAQGKGQKDDGISYGVFLQLVTAASNGVFNQSKLGEYQDMNHPLSHYYIASSHNTYLESDQLVGKSSVSRYVSDLTQGCRCVELDCWDGDDGQPIIYHGMTLTSRILFADVIRAVATYAFVKNPYPVILSIENHCSLEQQGRMAEILNNVLGAAIMRPGEGIVNGCLPSPFAMKNRVLIKGKRLSEHSNGEESEEEEEEEDDEEAGQLALQSTSGAAAALGATQKKASLKKITSTKDAKKKSHSTHPDLSAITYLATGKVHNFAESASVPADLMCSYSESKTKKYLRKEAEVMAWIEHNKSHLSRIYPLGTRVDSSNLDPVGPWAAGNQLVALNYQTKDLPMQLNTSKFLENGNTGYLLKPAYMIAPGAVPLTGLTIKVHVISGQNLPKPGGSAHGEVIDPYVKVNVFGVGSDASESKTRVIRDNGFNPVWDETFTFRVANAEVAQLSFRVFDSDMDADDFIAFASIPVLALRPGFRCLPLRDEAGQRLGDMVYASLFVLIQFEKY